MNKFILYSFIILLVYGVAQVELHAAEKKRCYAPTLRVPRSNTVVAYQPIATQLTIATTPPPAEQLFNAVVSYDVPLVIKLLSGKEKPNIINARDVFNHNWTPLMWASAGGFEDLVQILLDAGADASLRDSEDRTASMLAAVYH